MTARAVNDGRWEAATWAPSSGLQLSARQTSGQRLGGETPPEEASRGPRGAGTGRLPEGQEWPGYLIGQWKNPERRKQHLLQPE